MVGAAEKVILLNSLAIMLVVVLLAGGLAWMGSHELEPIDRDLFWQPGVAIGLMVLAIAQMEIHLVFFLHLTTGPDNTNNALAVAFSALVIVLVGAGTLWIISNLNANIMPMDRITNPYTQP